MAQNGFTQEEKVRIRHHLGAWGMLAPVVRRIHPVKRDAAGVVMALVCTRCRDEKPAGEFNRDTSAHPTSHGYKMPCKACQRAGRAVRAKAYRARHPERVKDVLAKWLAKNPTYERDRGRRRYATDPVYRERTQAAAREWMKAHPEYARAAAKLRRARLAGAACDLTVDDARAVFEDYSGLCVYCLAPATTLDHVVPISKGGAHTRDNLVPACKRCNSAKHDKSLLVFLATRRVA